MFHPRDADATRRRLLDAATAEFAEHGIAGARVDRIAKAAASNKAQIYHYFGSKDGLFDAVFGQFVQASVESDYFDPVKLPETMGKVYDDFVAHPELSRLTAWYRLERNGTDALIRELVAANERKIALIAEAQRAGRVSSRFPADVLLGLGLTLAVAWLDLPPEFASLDRDYTPAERRAFIVDAVAALIA